MVKKFPFSDETLKALAFLNPDTREKVTSDEGKVKGFVLFLIISWTG